MSLLRLTFFMAAIPLIGCDASPQVPKAAKQNYPAVIPDSPERRAKAEREWRRMLDAYGVQQTPPDLYPVTYTPRSLLGVTGGIKIMAASPEPGTETIALRQAVKGFMDRWRELIGADPATVSLVAGDEAGGGRRLIYRQANYPFPLVGNFGEMTAVISKEGNLLQLDDRFIPLVEVPQRPVVEREVAAKVVLGQTFTYSDISGREQKVRINSPDEVSVKRMVIVPVEKADSLEIRLAWELVAGKSLTWTVYVDAITGEQLQAVQNFNT